MKLSINLKYSKLALAIALMPALSISVQAGEVIDFVGATGDGYILLDEEENVVAPGIKAMTSILNNDDFKSSNGFSPNKVPNCIMASNDAVCDGPQGSGKRVKNKITGPKPFDTVYNVRKSGGTTEYFNFGKLSNESNARMTGFVIQLGTGSGDDFVLTSQSGEALTMDQVAALTGRAETWPGNGAVEGETPVGQDPLQRVNFPNGLFGNGGQDRPGLGGYYSDENAGFVFVAEGSDTLIASDLFGKHTEIFGNGITPLSQVPQAVVFDEDGDPLTDDALIFWKAGSLWLDGEGKVISQAEVDKLLEQEAYYIDVIEDLANVNLNYSFDLGDMNGEQMTVRFIPVFSNMVMAAQSEYQAAIAISLDNTEVPYLMYDQNTAVGEAAQVNQEVVDQFKEITTTLNNMSPGEARQGLERAGTSYLRNFGTQAQLLGRDQIELVLQHLSNGRSLSNLRNNHSASASSMDSMGTATSAEEAASMLANNGSSVVQLTDRLTTFMSASVSTGDIKSTQNGIGSDYTGYTFVMGADYQIADSLRAGGALSYGKNKADIDDHRGKLDAKGYSVLAYGTFGERTGLYADVAAAHTWLDFDNKRNISIGDFNRQAKSSTDGTQWSFAAKTGYNFDLKPLLIGPSIQYHWHDLKVDSYNEKGAGVLSMNVDDMKFKSQTLWLGGQASLPLAVNNGVIEPFASVHWVKEFEDSSSRVATSYIQGATPFYTPLDSYDDKYMRASVGVMGSFVTSGGLPVELSASYDGTFKNDDFDQNRFQLGAAIRF